jgi:hypothetical protein
MVPAMSVNLSRLVDAPIDDVFAFFDDPINTLGANDHATHLEIVDVQPDGRRTFDVAMRAGAKEWMQTVEQVQREPPTRLLTHGGTWTTDRHHWLLVVATDLRFSPDGDRTRVNVRVEAHLDRPFRRPLEALRNWIHRGAARAEFERQLDLLANAIEGAGKPVRSEP